MIIIARPSEQAIEWCARHKLCKGCPFNGGECVAPVDYFHNHDAYNKHVHKMNNLIKQEMEKD